MFSLGSANEDSMIALYMLHNEFRGMLSGKVDENISEVVYHV